MKLLVSDNLARIKRETSNGFSGRYLSKVFEPESEREFSKRDHKFKREADYSIVWVVGFFIEVILKSWNKLKPNGWVQSAIRPECFIF